MTPEHNRGLFPEWQDEYLAKHEVELGQPERIRVMWKMYGLADSETTCGKCRFFHRYSQGARWAKCDKTVQTGGRGTDWLARWPACGLFVEDKAHA